MTTATDTRTGTPDAPDDILGLLRQQAGLYARLESCAARQRSLVTGDDVGPLLALLGDRQRLSEQMTRLGERLAPVRRNWSRHRQELAPADQAEAERLLKETQARLQRVIEGDERDARVLSVRKEAVARTLRATHTTTQAISAYHLPSNHSGRLDCVDEGAR